jgi:2-hydroxychromene-2-carboxylate isomerase
MSETRRRGGTPIEFWFDFASGYAYFAALEIEALAERHGRTIAWRPFTLGAAFKVTGAQGLSRTPIKRDYARRDWQRLARLKGVPFSLPENHPRTGLPAIRAFYHLGGRTDAHAAASRSLIIKLPPGPRSVDPTPSRPWQPHPGSTGRRSGGYPGPT